MRPGLSHVIALSLLLGLAAGTCQAADSAGDEFFEKQVRPLLVEKCQSCHGDKKSKGGLKLNSRAALLLGGELGPAVMPGYPDQSLLIKAVRYHDDLHMPPNAKLADKQIGVLEQWVKLGAPWPGGSTMPSDSERRFVLTDKHRQFWSFRPVRMAPIPTVQNTTWPKTAVDRFILSALETNHLTPTLPADKRTLLRRVKFDLLGLPPTPEELEAFLKDDSPEAYARVVDRLLASPHYGERWGRHWLDVVRYADARDLIQLPKESDFREAWRYRDWVVDSFNRDLPYADFVRYQVAGDLIPSSQPGGFNADGLVATGLLAIADFVPGDVDKNQMIADYVNDQVDVVSRAFLGLSVACARCHDHKFDPISTEDYYALAGIFFSTRIIPGPVAGNTPLVKVPLLSPGELERIKAQATDDNRRRAELAKALTEVADSTYRDVLKRMLTEQSARYLLAARDCRSAVRPAPATVAQRQGLDSGLLTAWIGLLDRIAKHSKATYPPALRKFATMTQAESAQVTAASTVQDIFAREVKRADDVLPRTPMHEVANRSLLLHFRADDPGITTDAAGHVTNWPNACGFSGDATPPAPPRAPVIASTKIGDHKKSVVRFDGQALLAADRPVPPAGSLFVVYRSGTRAGERLVGWEDADRGQHGLGLMTDPGGRLHAILRKDGQSGDLVSETKQIGFETVCLTWGSGGTTMSRNGVQTAAKTIEGLSSDPKIFALKIGGPGSGNSPHFSGDIAELRIYDRVLNETERHQVEAELHSTWFKATNAKKPERDPVATLVAELLSSNGPFWLSTEERKLQLGPDIQKRLSSMQVELELLRKKSPPIIPEAVVVQDGGPKGTRHEGFKDAHVFIRGDSKRLGKPIPRGFPKVLTGAAVAKITSGSGWLQLADWLARPDNPLTARLMVNRIWQHHFGEGLVRTSNDFGERGERPTHPELLDYLATQFIESGWSIKSLHRLILLSAVYQQSSDARPETLAIDPENRLIGHTNRQRLDAEAIRDSLLTVSGRLNAAPGGVAFSDLATPRRTLYLMSARTGANTSDFGRLFDRADPSMIVAQRGQSIVAPQALFFLNDPFATSIAHALAARVRADTLANSAARITRLYALALGRPPTSDEIELGTKLLGPTAPSDSLDSLDRYCLLLLSTNEFLYVD